MSSMILKNIIKFVKPCFDTFRCAVYIPNFETYPSENLNLNIDKIHMIKLYPSGCYNTG